MTSTEDIGLKTKKLEKNDFLRIIKMPSGSLKIGLLPGLSDDSRDEIDVVDLEKGKGSPGAKVSREGQGSEREGVAHMQ
eukprot:12900403-Prorocentrum_lima.AAC.1